MGFTFDWTNEDRTALAGVCEGRWKWSDLFAAIKTAEAMLSSVHHPVTLIVDFKDNDWLPAGATVYFKRLASFLDHPHIQMVILVRPPTLIKIYTNLFLQNYTWFSDQFYLVASWDDAYTCLNSQASAPPPAASYWPRAGYVWQSGLQDRGVLEP